MKWKITQQQMDNLLEAQKFWATVPPDSVNLDSWRELSRNDGVPQCGSAACFGGWLPYMPHFQALGVYAERGRGRPLLPHEKGSISAELFGWKLFDPSGGTAVPARARQPDLPSYDARIKPDDTSLSDHEIVVQRLKHAISMSEV